MILMPFWHILKSGPSVMLNLEDVRPYSILYSDFYEDKREYLFRNGDIILYLHVRNLLCDSTLTPKV